MANEAVSLNGSFHYHPEYPPSFILVYSHTYDIFPLIDLALHYGKCKGEEKEKKGGDPSRDVFAVKNGRHTRQ